MIRSTEEETMQELAMKPAAPHILTINGGSSSIKATSGKDHPCR
jgi:hypothetical protein